MTKQTKKCQAHYSCVEHNIMYKTQFSMLKRNGSPTYKPGAERRLREAQGQQKDEALIKEGGEEDYYAFFYANVDTESRDANYCGYDLNVV